MNDQPKPATEIPLDQRNIGSWRKPATVEAEKLADWILNRLPATGGDVEFTRLELETRINAALESAKQDFAKQIAAERENYQRTVTDFLKCHAVETEEGVKALAERSFELHECQKQLAAERERNMITPVKGQDLSP